MGAGGGRRESRARAEMISDKQVAVEAWGHVGVKILSYFYFPLVSKKQLVANLSICGFRKIQEQLPE